MPINILMRMRMLLEYGGPLGGWYPIERKKTRKYEATHIFPTAVGKN